MFQFIKHQHEHLGDRDLLIHLLDNQLFINQKLDSLMDKATFLAAIADLKTEVGTVATKVDTLEQKINNSPTNVDPDIVAAFQDLKGSVDLLNTKADNAPAAAGDQPGTTTAP
jgi:uncharacterized protein YoxC